MKGEGAIARAMSITWFSSSSFLAISGRQEGKSASLA
jgi:hypothetical protein